MHDGLAKSRQHPDTSASTGSARTVGFNTIREFPFALSLSKGLFFHECIKRT
jgi:hypothetical protein